VDLVAASPIVSLFAASHIASHLAAIIVSQVGALHEHLKQFDSRDSW
jgi:hypothetical protein